MLENAGGDGICGRGREIVRLSGAGGMRGRDALATAGGGHRRYFHNMQLYFTLVTVIRVTILINSVQNRG